MAQLSTALPTLDNYQLHLPAFEGPLDVLLRLIERDQLAISDISLLAVFDQFMTYVDSLETSTPLVIAEFVAVAGRLSVLKSRALLPRPAKIVEAPDELDLVRQLEEYRAVKAAAQLLANRQGAGCGAFGRGDSVAIPEVEPARIALQPPLALAKAMGRWLTRMPMKPILVPAFRVVSLREMMVKIHAALAGDRRISFDCIRAGCNSRQETAVAFLAILTLMRRQVIVVTQAELFGSILLSHAKSDPTSGSHPIALKPTQANGHRNVSA